MTSAGGATVRGVVRLLNTSGGRVLCLAGAVDDAVVDAFLRRYGREPVPVDRVEAGSVVVASAAARALVLAHLRVAREAGRRVVLSAPPRLAELLAIATPSGSSPG